MVNTRSTELRLDRLEKAVADIKLQMSTFDARISKCIDDALAPFWRELQSRGITRERGQHDFFTLDDQHSSHTNNTKSYNFNTEPTPPSLPPAPAPPTTSPLLQEIQPAQQPPLAFPHLDALSIPANQHFRKLPVTQCNVALPPSILPVKLLAHSPPLDMTTEHLEYEQLFASPATRIPKQCINVVGRFLLFGNVDSFRKHEYEPPPVKAMCLGFKLQPCGQGCFDSGAIDRDQANDLHYLLRSFSLLWKRLP